MKEKQNMKRRDWENMTAAELEAEVERHNRLYFVEHSPEVSDYEFDKLVEALRRKKPESKALALIPSDVRSFGKKVRHVLPMLSLDKCYDEAALKDWAAKFEGDCIASPKIDGCAVSLRYDKGGRLELAATRGDGIEGEDVTANARHIKSVPQAVKLKNVEARGEVYMPLSVFSRYRGEFSNPRNLAAGAIKQKDPKKTGEYSLSFFAYDILGTDAKTEMEKYALLEKNGFSVVTHEAVEKDEMQSAFEYFLKKKDGFDFETDGVVFKANLMAEQERLGQTAHHPRWGIAYKFQGGSGTTTLIGVEWSVARTGVITPVAIVEPVELSGAMVRRASLHNVGIMKGLKITKGAKVLMMRRGGVIPNLESVVQKGDGAIEIPKHCPSCGAPAKIEDDFLYCTSPKSCVKSKIGELEHFVKVLGIDGFGTKLLAKLYDSGFVTGASELYELTMDDLLQVERMGETLAVKLLGNIAAHKNVQLGVFLQSLGIRELGRHTAKILENFGTLEKVLALSEEELSFLHTIGPVIAREVVSGLKSRRILIGKLLKHIKITAPAKTKKEDGALAGMTFIFTGVLLAMERSKAERLVGEKGGETLQAVTKNLDFLVVGGGGGAGSKLLKAKKLITGGGKVKIISEKEFLKMAGGKP